jgi:hypothetical protein
MRGDAGRNYLLPSCFVRVCVGWLVTGWVAARWSDAVNTH